MFKTLASRNPDWEDVARETISPAPQVILAGGGEVPLRGSELP